MAVEDGKLEENLVHPVFGLLRNSVVVYGDIIEPVMEVWEAQG